MKFAPEFSRPRTLRWLSFPLAFGARLLAVLPVAAVMFAQPAPAGPGAIEGRVLNPATGDYLYNARVTVPGTQQAALTDSAGSYRLGNLPAGSVTLHVSYPGLDDQDIVVNVAAGQTARRDIDLTSKARYGTTGETVQLSEFTVAATREMDGTTIATNEQRYAPNIKKVMAAEAFGDISEGNVGEFLKYLPGVTVNYAAQDANNISLRGLPGNTTPISVDGERMASASSSNASRTVELEQISVSNIARAEVVKSITPSMWADALGGAVNLVTKSAFERSKPEFRFQGFLSYNLDDLNLKKTPGTNPKASSAPNYKLLPGYQFSYLKPVTENFGFTLSSLYSDQVSRLRTAIATWDRATNNGGSVAAPFLRGIQVNDDPRRTLRQSYALTTDWRPVQPLTLSFSYQWNSYDLFTQPTRISFNTGTLPPSYDPTFTQGRAGAGSITHAPLWWSKYGNTNSLRLGGKFRRNDWRGDFSVAYSKATNTYRDTSEGFFRAVTDRIVTPTVRFEGVSGIEAPGNIVVRDNTGAVVDWTKMSSYQITQAESDSRQSWDAISSARLNARREFDVAHVPVALQLGGAVRQQERDRHVGQGLWSFVGADGRAGTADDNAGIIADDSYVGQDPHFGWRKDIQWPDMRKFYQVYVQHPSWFVLNETNSWIINAQNSERIKETISAGYVQGEAKLFEQKLALVGGVRWEGTRDSGIGLKRDRDAIYQHDASGRVIRNAANQPVLVTTDTLQQTKLQYIERGAHSSISYDDYYPSLAATYTLRDNLLLRLGYARTMGRPDFSNIIPNFDVDENEAAAPGTPGGTVTMRNPKLKPWTANNYDASVEYYFAKSGSISVGGFLKDIKNAFGSGHFTLDNALLQQFELPSTYEGWILNVPTNLTSTARVTGVEFSYQQALTMLPAWARGTSVFASGTLLHLSGGGADDFDFGNLIEKSASWGVAYSFRRLAVRLNWNYVGQRSETRQTFAPDALRYLAPRLMLDANFEFRLSRRFALFANARNLTGERLTNRFTTGGGTPAYSTNDSVGTFGTKGTFGISGSF